MKASFSIGRDLASKLIASENRGHWLYDVRESPLLRDFLDRNPHVNPSWDIRHYLVVASNDVIDVISAEQPIISARTDSVRGWIRPGEKRSASPGGMELRGQMIRFKKPWPCVAGTPTAAALPARPHRAGWRCSLAA